jgi:UDP-N-acetylglucosamine 2-epimerase (non-hydrolysing)
MLEVLMTHRLSIEQSKILDKLCLKQNEFFIVSSHREENVDNPVNFNDFLESLEAINKHYNFPVIVSTHPRTRKKIEAAGTKIINDKIHFMKPMGFFDYMKMQLNAFCVISDSGTITEEASILGFPAITIRPAHERPEGMDEGTLIMCGLKKENVIDAIKVVTSQKEESLTSRCVPDYDVSNVSMKVVRIILSYIDYVKRTVWRKGY